MDSLELFSLIPNAVGNPRLEGVGGTAQSPVDVPSGLNDSKIFVSRTVIYLREIVYAQLSRIWTDVRTIVSKSRYKSRVATKRGGQWGGGASNQPPTSAPRGSKGSDNTKTFRETSHPDNTSVSPSSKKQKQTPSHLQSHPQSSTELPSHVD